MSNIINLADVRCIERQSVRPVVFINRAVVTEGTEYELWSVSKESVQAEIRFLTAHVESQGGGGEAHFVGPYRKNGIWEAKGLVTIHE